MSKKGKSKVKERNKAQSKSAAHASADDKAEAPPRKLRVPSIQELDPDWIADMSESILENPDTAFSSSSASSGEGDARKASGREKAPMASKMRQLLVAASCCLNQSQNKHNKQNQHNMNVENDDYLNRSRHADLARLALLSLLAIYQDMIPDYRIRLPSVSVM